MAMSFSLEGGHYDLDQLIKNAEFENKLQDKAILVEQEKIDAFKKEIDLTLSEIKWMEREVEENKLLQAKCDQKSPQYKENYDSLKKTSTVLDEHINALEKKLETKCQFLFEQREKRSEAINRYDGLWASYKKKYESSIKGQQYSTLSEEVSRLEAYNQQFESEIELLKHSLEKRQLQLQRKNSFDQIFPWIIQFASYQLEKEHLYNSIKELHKCNCNLVEQVKSTKIEIKKTKEEQSGNRVPTPHNEVEDDNVMNSHRLTPQLIKPASLIRMPTLPTPVSATIKSSVITPPVSRPSSTLTLSSALSRPSSSFNITPLIVSKPSTVLRPSSLSKSSLSKSSTMSVPSFLKSNAIGKTNFPSGPSDPPPTTGSSSSYPSPIVSRPRDPSPIVSRPSNLFIINSRPSDESSAVLSSSMEPTPNPLPQIQQSTDSFPMEPRPSDNFPVVSRPSDVSTGNAFDIDINSMETDNTTNVDFTFFEEHEGSGVSADFFSNDTGGQPFDFLSSFAPIGGVDHSNATVNGNNDFANLESLIDQNNDSTSSGGGNMFSFLDSSTNTASNEVFDIFNFGGNYNGSGASSNNNSGGAGSFFNF